MVQVPMVQMSLIQPPIVHTSMMQTPVLHPPVVHVPMVQAHTMQEVCMKQPRKGTTEVRAMLQKDKWWDEDCWSSGEDDWTEGVEDECSNSISVQPLVIHKEKKPPGVPQHTITVHDLTQTELQDLAKPYWQKLGERLAKQLLRL